ncbi:HAMP domain-containing histidine kinase [Candidatus Woesearchaeota archaeon]|nr:HAMP domain-containing histidine kinase [Candidatus Woesearchaeota archaeon]
MSDIAKEIEEMFDSDESSDENRLRNFIRVEKHSALSHLVASIAHDSNGFITPIMGAADLGKMRAEEIGDKEQITCFDLILESSEKLKSLINSLLDFSKRRELTRGTVYINDILQTVVNLYQSQYKQAGVSLETDLEEIPVIDGYPAGLENVFVNMVTNALQAYADTPQERSKTVNINSYHQDGYIFVEFEDDGCGIKDTDKSKIFDAWYTTKGKKGHGLGLANALLIVQDSHFGKLCVDSEYGKGTKFTIKLPDAKTISVMRAETFRIIRPKD